METSLEKRIEASIETGTRRAYIEMSHSQIIKAIDLVKSGNNGLAVTILENVRDELSNPDYVEEKIAHTIANT